MATVSSNLTRINDIEGALTLSNIGSGGGAGADTDIFLQASQSASRRRSNVTLEGFWLNDGTANDLSGADIHVGVWAWVTHYASLTDLEFWIGTSTANYDRHNFDYANEYPKLGGWIRIWVDISRTPEATGGTGLNEASAQYFGLAMSLPTVGGTTPNLAMDAIDHTTTGLTLTGTTGLWSDFTTADQNTTNQYGVIRIVGGIYNCFARLTLGTASSLAMTESNFNIVFPQQNLVNDTFMGITADLQHASTNITWSNGVIKSAGSKRGDLVVTSTSGSFTASNMTLSTLRLITLTSACSLTKSLLASCGQITAPGATLTNNTYSGYEGTADSAYLVWDVNTNTDGKLDNSSFTKGTAATHAIQLGTTSPTSVTLRGISFSGYNASNSQNDSTILVSRTTGTVTISLVGCSGNISYKSAGATVVFVVDPVTTQVTVKDVDSGSAIQDARVLLRASDGTGPMAYQKSTTITRSGATATASCTAHGLITNDYAVVKGATQPEYNGVFQITRIDDNSFSYTVTGTPATPATGTIVTTGAPLYGLTNASGILSTTRSFSSSQPVSGWIRKASSADNPKYKTSAVSGTISSTTGLATTIQMIKDQ